MEGDIRVQLKRPPQIDFRKEYDWSFVMEAIGGGIIEATDRFPYLAPESGYKPRYELVMSPSNPNWSNSIEKKFYLSSRGGKVYASIQMRIFTYDDASGIELNYFANPAGSRNLEFDPAKAIDPERIKSVGLEKAIEEVKAKSKKAALN